MNEKRYDVIIVGAGPSGIFTALTLAEYSNLKIAIFDKGPDIEKRVELLEKTKQVSPAILSGWGGAGAFSDGKLTLSPDVGGWLNEYLSYEELEELIKQVDNVFLRFGAPKKIFGEDEKAIENITRKAQMIGMRLIPERIRHMGREYAKHVLKKIKDHLTALGVDIYLETKVDHIKTGNGAVKGVSTERGNVYSARYVVAAPGRGGAEWLRHEVDRLSLEYEANPIDIGVRVEVPAAVMENLTGVLYEPKLYYTTKVFDDVVRTFCVNPYGVVITETYDDVIMVNGQSFASKKTENTNFAILVNVRFTRPFKEPIAYGKYIARLANMLTGGVIVQRLGDLKKGRRSTLERIKRNPVTPTLKTAVPGDISFVLPYRFLANILEMLEALDKLSPGVNSDYTLLYGVEAKFYSLRVRVNREMETDIKNLYVVGDGAGLTRSLVQSSASGMIAAKSILKKEGFLKNY